MNIHVGPLAPEVSVAPRGTVLFIFARPTSLWAADEKDLAEMQAESEGLDFQSHCESEGMDVGAIESSIRQGDYVEIWLAGDEVTATMKRIARVARTVKVTVKNQSEMAH